MSYEERADELDGEAEQMEERSGEVGGQIADVRSDWEAKKGDGGVPGAVPVEGESEEEGSDAGAADEETGEED